MMGSTQPLSGRGAIIRWERDGLVTGIHWGNSEFCVPQDLFDCILNQFFIDPDHWYPLGAGMDAPMPGGLGEFLQARSNLEPRHASAVAAILVAEGLLHYRGRKPIELRKCTKTTAQS